MKEHSIKVSQMPNNSFYAFDLLQLFKYNNVYFMALADNELKSADSMPIDITVTLSTPERFKEEMDKATINTAWSHTIKESLSRTIELKLLKEEV